MRRYRFGRPAVGLTLLLIGFSAGAGGAPGAPTEVADFGANPGQLRMFRYIPDGLRDPAPLVVVLHGCKQTAAPYAEASGWMHYADRWGFALLLPEQRPDNNRWRCLTGSVRRARRAIAEKRSRSGG